MVHHMKPFIAFADKVQTFLSQGTDGSGREQKYVPYSALKEYWDTDGISEVINSLPGASQNVMVETIQKQFLRIFSTLTYCTKQNAFRMNYIERFIRNGIDDHNLPLDNRNPVFSNIFPNSEEGRESWRAFNEHQFLFNPFPLGEDFPHNRTLAEKRLLPWKAGEVLSDPEDDTTIVQLYTINSDCVLHEEVETIAVKKTRLRHRNGGLNQEAEETFANELEAYGALRNRSERTKCQNHFLEYYGSFKQGGWGYLLLEYADQGSLEQFYSKNNTPHNFAEAHDLWEGMFSLLQGLTILHNLDKDVTNSILRGIHQDLKPTNIFVFQAHTGKLGYKYRFKIGDFGLSSIRRRKAIHPDNKGTKMYGAPELTTSVLDLQDLDFGATNKVDIWSMGCIYYEMLVWITCGQRGRDEFLSMRVNEGGSEAAFHNHTEDLSALDDMLKLLLSRRRIFDHLTEPIAERIQCSMLCFEPKDRLAARFLLTEFKKVLEKAKSVEKGAVSAETPVSGSGFQYEQQFQGRHDHPRTPQPRSADNSRVSSLRSSALGYHPDTASIQTPQDSFGITMTSDLNSREATHARQSAPGRARGQAPHLTLQTTGPWQEMTTFETQLPPTRTVTRHETNVSPSTNRHNPGNRTRPSPGNHRVSAPAGTSDRSPRQSKHLALRPFSTDPAGSAGSSGQSLVANSGQFPDGGKWPDDPRVWDILRYKKEKKAKLLPDDFKLPGQEIALDYQGGREQIFVLDDSKSMNKHKQHVIDMVEALSYLIKGCDSDGIDLFLISQPKNPIKAKKDASGILVKYLQSLQAPTKQNGNIERNFGHILDKAKGMKAGTGPMASLLSLASSKSQTEVKKPDLSIYVLTDGIWDGDDKNGCPAIAVPIRNLIRQMKESHRDRAAVMIQFIQFGDDKEGTRRLRYLDNKLSLEPDMKDYDIIDRKPFDSNIWEILIGSLSRRNDGEDSEDEGEEAQKFHDAYDGYEDKTAAQPNGGAQFGRTVQGDDGHIYERRHREDERAHHSGLPPNERQGTIFHNPNYHPGPGARR